MPSPTKSARLLGMWRTPCVRGSPTVLLQDAGGLSVLTHGYRPLDDLQPTLDAWLSGPWTGLMTRGGASVPRTWIAGLREGYP